MKISEKQKLALEAIMKLELGDVARRVWPSENPSVNTQAVVLDYRRWLALRVLYPDRVIPPVGCPSHAVDKLWHAHITDTRKYQADCQTIFGEYLHHDPTPVGRDAAREAWKLYSRTFTANAWGRPDPAIAGLMIEAAEMPDASKTGDDFDDCG